MSPRAGDLNKQIEIQQPVTSTGETGQQEKNYVTVATVWAKIRTLSGNERLMSQQVGAMLTHEVTIRYDASLGLKPTYRIKYGSRVFDIKDVRDVDEANVEYRMRCVEAVV